MINDSIKKYLFKKIFLIILRNPLKIMESNIENIEDIHFSKIKYIDDNNIQDIPDKLLNHDLNFININSFSHLGTTNLPTDFNNLTDLDYFDGDFSLIHNIKMNSNNNTNNNNFPFLKNKEKKINLDNTFDNVNVNLIEEINNKRNFEDSFLFYDKVKIEDSKVENDIFSNLSYNQTLINIPKNNLKLKSSSIKNNNPNLKNKYEQSSINKRPLSKIKSNSKCKINYFLFLFF